MGIFCVVIMNSSSNAILLCITTWSTLCKHASTKLNRHPSYLYNYNSRSIHTFTIIIPCKKNTVTSPKKVREIPITILANTPGIEAFHRLVGVTFKLLGFQAEVWISV